MSDSLRPHGLQHARPPCPSPAPRVYSNSCPLSQWCHSTISSSVIPFFHLQSFPASGSFPLSQLFASVGQSCKLQLQHQSFQWIFRTDFLLYWLVGSPCSPRNSRVFFNTTIQKHQLLGTQCSSWSTLTSIHDHWKTHRFDYMDLWQQNNVSSF